MVDKVRVCVAFAPELEEVVNSLIASIFQLAEPLLFEQVLVFWLSLIQDVDLRRCESLPVPHPRLGLRGMIQLVEDLLHFIVTVESLACKGQLVQRLPHQVSFIWFGHFK